MKKITIVGAQWGDEGKGKVVNYFSYDFDWVIRFAGGANAGHTIYYKDKKYVNHLLPSIVPNFKSKGLLGSGMVIELEQLIIELETMEKDFPGISKMFYIDDEAFLVMPWHKKEDELLESMKKNPIGTTKKGIGPAYTSKSARENLKIYNLFDEELLKNKVEEILFLKDNIYQGKLEVKAEEVIASLIKSRDRLLELKVNFKSAIGLKEDLDKSSLLFEGAQGVMLDLDFGTYPYVTSGCCTAYGVSVAGYSVSELDEVYGIMKAYTTRVGEGPFPTEIYAEEADELRKRGFEFGATTGRPRRIGWLDLPQMKYAKYRSKLTGIIMTKADVLNGYDKIKVCVAYDIDGEVVKMPRNTKDFIKAKPIYVEMDGWNTLEDDSFDKYVKFIESELELNIKYISYGPKTDEIKENK